ncbi:MAG: hypothetical protein ABF238_00440 [Flavobacteriales bacterium]
MKKIATIFTLTLFTTLVYSQQFEVPKNYEFTKEADYDKYENDIIDCVNWLMKTPFGKSMGKREDAVTFLAAYSVNNKRVNPYINKQDFPFLLNGDLGVIYVASWTKSCLTQNYVNNKEEFTLRATNQVVEYYLANQKKLRKAKGMKPFVQQKQQGTLDTFVKSKL